MGRAKKIDHHAIKKICLSFAVKPITESKAHQNCFCFLNKADCPTNSLKKNPD